MLKEKEPDRFQEENTGWFPQGTNTWLRKKEPEMGPENSKYGFVEIHIPHYFLLLLTCKPRN